MNMNAPRGTQAPLVEQSNEEKIDVLKKQIEEVAMRTSVLFRRVLTGLSDLSGVERLGLSLRCPELLRLLQLDNRGEQTAVEYDFNFKVAQIEKGEGTPAQKLEAYQTLLATFKKIHDEVREAEAAINGTPLSDTKKQRNASGAALLQTQKPI